MKSLSEKHKRVSKQLRSGFLDGGDWYGLDEVRTYLTGKGIRNLPDDPLLLTWEDSVRKRLEREGYPICNPTAQNGWRRTLVASDAVNMASTTTRRRTTRTRQQRDTRQLENLATAAESPKMRSLATSRLDVAEKVNDLLTAVEASERLADDLILELIVREEAVTGEVTGAA